MMSLYNNNNTTIDYSVYLYKCCLFKTGNFVLKLPLALQPHVDLVGFF